MVFSIIAIIGLKSPRNEAECRFDQMKLVICPRSEKEILSLDDFKTIDSLSCFSRWKDLFLVNHQA